MSADPTIYVITYHEFNHGNQRPGGAKPIDSRFLNTDKNYIFYLIDKTVPSELSKSNTLLEKDLDNELHLAGGKYLGEWSFLLAEEKYSFCHYPFFMISSRFYEKNLWLQTDLNAQWDSLFSYLQQYGWGYLPSYDRPIRWISLEWEAKIKKKTWEYKFFPFTEKTYSLTEQLFGVKIPNDYSFTADLFCNYIGFRSREELLSYVRFYRPLLNYFFNSDYTLKTDTSPYVRPTGTFRNEKSFTFILELLCHLFFFQKNKKYFALHYDGYYSIDELHQDLAQIQRFDLPLSLKIKRFVDWQWRKLNSEGAFSKLRPAMKNCPPIYKAYKTLKNLCQ